MTTTPDAYTACLGQLHASAGRLGRGFSSHDAWQLASQLSIAIPLLKEAETAVILHAAAVDLQNVIGIALTRGGEANEADAVEESCRFRSLLEATAGLSAAA